MLFRVILTVLCAFALAFSQLSFVSQPSITDNGGTWTIQFELSDSTDVEVSVVNVADSTVVRHLAAGMLGSNPPAPLQANSLSQTLVWDGKDDLGQPVSNTASVRARVRAGMSAEFDRFVGGNPYAFKDGNTGGYWSFNGMVQGDNGEVYVSGSAEPQQFACIRAYDGSGNYVRTVFPFRGDFQQTEVSGFGVNNWLNGGYSPKFAALHGPTLTSTILASYSGYSLLPINGPGEVAVGGGKGLRCLKLNDDGSIASGAAEVGLVTTPALPNHYFTFGPIYLNASHNPDYVYLSGYHEADSIDAGCHFVLAASTGFWRDGCVYRINMATGVAVQFVALDSVPLSGAVRDTRLGGPSDFFTAVHSVKADAQGRVFVCDRVHRQIGVYDSNGVMLGAIPNVPNPDQIALDPATGAIYVACRSGWHYDAKPMLLNKYSGWGASDSLVFSANLWLNYGETGVYLLVRPSAGGPLIWIANGDVGVRIYRDLGDTVELARDFYATRVPTLGFDRIGVDRRTETVYINNGNPDIYKVTDWSNPALVRCSTTTNQKLLASDFCITYDGQMYARGGSGFSGPIERWTLGDRHAPIPFPATGSNALIPYVYGRMGVMYGDKGLAVSPLDKHVAFMQMHGFAEYWVDAVAAGGRTDSGYSTILDVSTGGMGGVKYDLKGNLYVGATIWPSGHEIPDGLSSDFTFTHGGGGSVIRYTAGATGVISSSDHTATGSDRIYTPNLGPMSGFGACQCRSSRFDVDPYGRLFIPSGINQKITVIDNNDNRILQFGRYGNWDEQGSGSDVPFACPLSVAASENNLYVNDLINTRLAKIRMKFALDNMPGFLPLGAESPAVVSAAPCLNTRPNPFNPALRIALSGQRIADSNIGITIYNTNGKIIRRLSATGYQLSAGITWNASGLPSGFYFIRANLGGKTLTKKVLLAK